MIAEVAATGDFARALDLALESWRVTRDPLRADLVDALATHVPPTPIDEREYHKNWIALARADRAADLGALLAGLRKALPRKSRPFSDESQLPTSWLERMAALAARRDDPRIVKPLVAAMRVEWPGHGAKFVELYAAPARLIARTADVRAIDLLDGLLAFEREQPVTFLRRFTPEVVTPLLVELRARRVPPVEPEIAKLVALYRPEVPPAAARVPELYAMVHANPNDDGPRQVLADVLLELGDPRGELIALQLSPANTEEKAARIASLLREHRPAWLGDLDSVLKNVVFERGFVVSASLEANSKAGAAVWHRTPADDKLATIAHLYKGDGNEKHYSDFVFSPAMKNLRTVELLSNKMIARVCDATTPWSFENIVFAKEPGSKQIAALVKTPALPSWSTLEIATRLGNIDALVAVLEPLHARYGFALMTLRSMGGRLEPAWFTLVDRFAPTVLADQWIRVYRKDGELVVEHRRTPFTTMHPDVITRHVQHAVPTHDRLILL